jgi:DNA-binding CsgD family transcriptional regulator
MAQQLEAVINRLQTANSLEELRNSVVTLRDIYDIEHVVYHIVGATGREYGAFSYNQDWVDHYVDEKYYSFDPVVLTAFRHFMPLDWKRLDWSGRRERNLFGEAVGNGIGPQGVSVPIRGVNGVFALFSVTARATDRDWEKFTRENGRDFLLISHFVHQRATEIMGELADEEIRVLSPRERDVLAMLSAGKSRQEASDKLRISEHTFRVYVDSARHKLGAVNTVHAVALAINKGIISP